MEIRRICIMMLGILKRFTEVPGEEFCNEIIETSIN